MKPTLLTVSLAALLVSACDSGNALDNHPEEKPALTAAPLTLQMKINDVRTVDLEQSVTAVGIEKWALSNVDDSGGLGRIDNMQAHTFDYAAMSAGVTTLSYTVDGGGNRAASEILVAIQGETIGDNTFPVAQNVTAETDEDKALTIDLTQHVSDADGDPLTIGHVISSSGRFSDADNGLVTFEPNGFVGIDSAAYSVDDGRGGYDVAYIVITSGDPSTSENLPGTPNTAPTAKDFSDNINATLTPVWTVDLKDKDAIHDADGDALNVVEIYAGNQRVTFEGTTLTYTPGDFVGVDQFTYVISDGRGGFATGTVTLTVSKNEDGNTPPQASPLVVSNVVDNDRRPIRIDLSEKVSDADNDALSLVTVIGANGATALVADSPLEVEYTVPLPPKGLQDRFSYVVTDGKGGHAMSTVTVEMVSHNPNAPVAAITERDTLHNRPISINLDDVISDEETPNTELSVSNLNIQGADPAHQATATLSDKVVTYTPNGFVGVEVLTYTVSDGELSSEGVIVITVNQDGSHSLTAGDITQPIALSPNGTTAAVTIPWQDNVSTDASDGSPFTLVQAVGATLGTVSTADNALTYAPTPGKHGTDEFVYTIKDSHTPAHYAQGKVTVVLSPPDAPQITELTMTGIPAIGDILTANVTCDRCDAAKYQYKWIVNGLTVETAGTYAYRAEDVGLHVRLEVTGEDYYARTVKKATTYAITPRQIKQVAVTNGGENTAILYHSGVVKTLGTTPTVADKEASNIKEVVATPDGFVLIDNNNTLSAFSTQINAYTTRPGIPSAVADRENVKKVLCLSACAALRFDNRVVAWGPSDRGGRIPPAAQPYTTNVRSLVRSTWGFATIDSNGDAASWGYDRYKQNATPDDKPELRGMKAIMGAGDTWLGVKENGSLVRWGADPYFDYGDGQEFDDVKHRFTDVIAISSSNASYIALNGDGSAVAWKVGGGEWDFTHDSELTSDVVEVGALGSEDVVFARKSTGELYVMGQRDPELSLPAAPLTHIQKVVRNGRAAAALTEYGSVQTFGVAAYGANTSAVETHLRSGVIDVLAGATGFVAIKSGGDIVTWGTFSRAAPASVMRNIVSVEHVEGVFFARRTNGSVVSWGSGRLKGVSDIEDGLKYRLEKLN